MRIYVPATLDELEDTDVAAGGARWDLPARQVHAVTAALAGAYPEDDDEGHEYTAFLAAADDSLALVASRPAAVPLRAVVSLDVPDGVVRPADAGEDVPESAVEVAAVSGVAVVAVHVDEPEAAADVRAVLAAADDDQDDALDAALERVTDRDLLWYDPTEIPRIPRP